MRRGVIITIIVIALIVVGVGLYFLSTNKNSPSTSSQNQTQGQTNTTTSNSFQIQGMTVDILRPGTGDTAKDGDTVTVNYLGRLPDGKQFDSSYDRKQPFTFVLKQNTLVKGFYLGVVGMKIGEKRRLTVPPELGYGANGFLQIPANSSIIFEVELLAVNHPK